MILEALAYKVAQEEQKEQKKKEKSEWKKDFSELRKQLNGG